MKINNNRSEPTIQFAKSRDGVRIAYSVSGQGPVLVKAANWLSHIEYDWGSPVWQHWLNDISSQHTLVRYDERGCGLSDRVVDDLSFDSWVDDLEAVVNTIGLNQFALLGVSQGGAVAIAYAIRHPEKVSHLILYGAYSRGRLIRDESKTSLEEASTMRQLMKLGWGREHDAFRQVFSSLFMPGGTLELLQAFNELQRISCTADTAVKFLDEFNQIDVFDLASQVRCPTLVMHSRGDLRVPFDEGCLIASQIPGARFVALESKNHIILQEPAWQVFITKLNAFIKDRAKEKAEREQLSELTKREYEVLDKIASGLDNLAISELLSLREKTIRNHITNIFSKLNVNTRAKAIVFAREAGLGINKQKSL